MMIYLPGCGDCSCNNGSPCGDNLGDQYKTYSYFDTYPQGRYWQDCPNTCPCDNPNCSTGSCCNQSISGFIYSDPFTQGFFGKKLKATILANSTIDDLGSIGGVVFQYDGCGSPSYLVSDTEVTPLVEGNRLKLSFEARNGPQCGPFGLSAVSIHWSAK
jgi:hypothetical protein